MVTRNRNLVKLKTGYLFPEIERRKAELLSKQPDVKVINLGVGDTTEPVYSSISKAMERAARKLKTIEGYSGYGDERGLLELRKKIVDRFYSSDMKADEIAISDGAKCDLGRLQMLFDTQTPIAVQDPSYPVYIDSSVMVGRTNEYNQDKGIFNGVTYLKCSPENSFFPDLNKLKDRSIIFFCSPNNPTGVTSTKAQLEALVDAAVSTRSLIVFDAAYSMFISDEKLPKSIYDIKGSRKVAIEMNSFSKTAGFTGVRLGWTVVPEDLLFDDGSSVKDDWHRVVSTVFNSASIIAQHGGVAALEQEGYDAIKKGVAYYMENAAIINECLGELGIQHYGGSDSPYIFARYEGESSWDAFSRLLENTHILTIPGVGFGPSGEGFLRFSAFAHRKNVEEAASRLKRGHA